MSSVDNRGQIARNTDSDTFTFAIGSGGGRATLVVDRIEYFAGAYLDVDAAIQDASGMTIAQSNDKVARTAKFDVSLPAGEYRLIIKGGAEGTPQNGFSNYSSLGYYGISGTITGVVVGGGGARWDRWWFRGERRRRPWGHQRRRRRRSGGARRHDRRGWQRERRPWGQHGRRWIERCRGWGTRR